MPLTLKEALGVGVHLGLREDTREETPERATGKYIHPPGWSTATFFTSLFPGQVPGEVGSGVLEP